MIVIALILLIVFDALGDGLKDKPAKHLFQTSLVLGWLLFPVFLFYSKQWHWVTFPDFVVMIIGYACLRYFLFDLIWNIASGQRIDYIGNTSIYDKILIRVHPTFVFFTKLLAGAIGFTILLK